MYADPYWIQSNAGDIANDEAFIGNIYNPFSCVTKPRAFWRRKIEETGKDQFCELANLYIVALAKHSDEANNATAEYALITGFINGEIIELNFYEASSISIIKAFIAAISAALKADPKKRGYIINKKVFMELIEKLTTVEIHTVSKVGYTPMRKKYDKNYKLAAVMRAKTSPLSMNQVAKEFNISDSDLSNWLHQYDKHGENAFPGGGRKSKYKRVIGAPGQSESAEATTPSADSSTDTI